MKPVVTTVETDFRFEALDAFLNGDGRTGRLLPDGQLLQTGLPLTVIQVEELARYLGALDQGHACQLLDLQTLVAEERSLNLAAGAK